MVASISGKKASGHSLCFSASTSFVLVGVLLSMPKYTQTHTPVRISHGYVSYVDSEDPVVFFS